MVELLGVMRINDVDSAKIVTKQAGGVEQSTPNLCFNLRKEILSEEEA